MFMPLIALLPNFFDQFDLRVGIKGRGVTGMPSSIRDFASSGFASP